MRLVLLFVAMLAILAEHVDIASAQSEETVEVLRAQAEALYKIGKYTAAAVIAERAVAVAERQFGPEHPAMAPPLEDLAYLRYQLGRYVEAEPLYRRSLAIRERVLRTEHPDVAATLNGLASGCSGPSAFFADRERAFEERLDLVIASLHLQKHGPPGMAQRLTANPVR